MLFLFLRVCSRAGEVDKLKRSFSARLRSATSPLQQRNQDNELKIHALETIALSQQQRDKDKDRKIAELEEKVEAIAHARPKEPPERRQEEERTILLRKDEDIEPEMEKGRRSGVENKKRLRKSTATPQLSQLQTEESVKEPSEMSFQEKRLFFEKNEETPVYGHSLPTAKNRYSCIRKLSFSLKRKPSQSNRSAT